MENKYYHQYPHKLTKKPPRDTTPRFDHSGKVYLVEFRPPKAREKIMPANWGPGIGGFELSTWSLDFNGALDYPVVVGEISEDDDGNVQYIYYEDQTPKFA